MRIVGRMYVIIVMSYWKTRNLLNMKRRGLWLIGQELKGNELLNVLSYRILRSRKENVRSKFVMWKDDRFVIACPRRDRTIMKWYIYVLYLEGLNIQRNMLLASSHSEAWRSELGCRRVTPRTQAIHHTSIMKANLLLDFQESWERRQLHSTS